MRLVSLLAIAIILALTTMSQHVHSQMASNTSASSDDISVYLGMHTINFTQVLATGVEGSRGSIGYLGANVSKILEAIKNITLGCDTLSCITANVSARASIEQSLRELERSGYIDPGAVDEVISSIYQTSMSDEALRRLLSNPDILQLIASVSADNPPINVLGVLDSLFRGGRISLSEYIAALELLKRISVNQGLQGDALAIDKMQLEIIRQLIISRTAEGLVRGLANILVSSNISSQQIQTGHVNNGGNVYLGYRPYPIYLPLPGGVLSMDQPYMFLALLGFSAVVAIIAIGIPRKRLRRTSIRGKDEAQRISQSRFTGIVRIYWRAVEILSARVPRGRSETHREYLEKVRRTIRVPGAFEDLTEIYERVRYAHEPEERYYERALKDYRELGGDETD
ncbi:MAG: DUF4129 domain-containing protein [Desulfurococcales archaeon]|jgi:hypothetical protein